MIAGRPNADAHSDSEGGRAVTDRPSGSARLGIDFDISHTVAMLGATAASRWTPGLVVAAAVLSAFQALPLMPNATISNRWFPDAGHGGRVRRAPVAAQVP